jgi:uncharacterized membrane protein (TIGR01666 family)
MEYTKAFRKFISSQYLYAGVRITAGTLIPAIVLYQLGWLDQMMAIPLGALSLAITDTPGPPKHRRNSLIVSIILYFFVVLLAGVSRDYPWLVGIEIAVIGFLFSMAGVFGTRINSIGLIGILVYIFCLDPRSPSESILHDALLFTIGGVWYALLTMTLYSLRPYKPIQQLLGENLMLIAEYLQDKAAIYQKGVNYEDKYQSLIKHQINIQSQQEELQEMLFKMRSIQKESIGKGRMLMIMYLDSIDLFERVMTTQQDYTLLHKEFDHTNILEVYRKTILLMADELGAIGLAVQDGIPYKKNDKIARQIDYTLQSFIQLRDNTLNPDNIESFIRLRHILYSIQDVAERIELLQKYTYYDRSIVKPKDLDEKSLEHFVVQQDLDPHLFIDNLSVQSSYFRHAFRTTIALLIGYGVSLFFELGHGSWILLTIVTIMKPAYSITQKRNWQRISGTISGAAISFLFLYLVHDNTPIFIAMVLSMIIGYSFVKKNYLIGTAGITMYVMMNFHFLHPGGLTEVLSDRVLDTAIGSVIAFITAKFVLPQWEHTTLLPTVQTALQANQQYFDVVASVFSGKKPSNNIISAARKEAFVALANMSNRFQRMISEPKSKQPHLQQYHQFISVSHLLTSHIASLSYYAQRSGEEIASQDFQPLIEHADIQFKRAINLLDNKIEKVPTDTFYDDALHQRLQELMVKRKEEMLSGLAENEQSVRKALSELKATADQFKLIHSIITEQVRILERIHNKQLEEISVK